jgi:two-component system phosphate regulon response regulator OmpR
VNDTAPQRILVVDDDPDVRWMVETYLGKHGFHTDGADGGGEMRARLAAGDYALVVLDITMPGEDGLTLARYLREHHACGILMLTAAGEVIDRIVGLEVGADDYMTKPFEPRELLARVKSVLRRIADEAHAAAAHPAHAPPRLVAFGDFRLDLEHGLLRDGEGREVPLTQMEFDLLKAFAEHPNRVLSRDELLDLAHNRAWDPYDRSIDIRIARLRRKIEPDPARPRIIRTVRGAGYIYVGER